MKSLLKGFMVLHRDVNVFIKTSSEKVLGNFLNILNKEKEYAFRCPEWTSSLIMKTFKPQREGYVGVILLTYYTDTKMFKRYVNPNYAVKLLSDDSAREIMEHTRRPFTIEFIQDRIRRGYFYGIYDNQELISHIGTLWESNEACEIGFAYTKEKHRGRGLAKTLTSIVTDKTLKEGKIPLLHTVETNIPAIRACEALGYRIGAREWGYFYTPKQV
ncbi:MAG: GNAT family N-acetyltransferase [Candidatus Bathyarchaeia archaeon]|nr:GNAT family N-acetyltransferase [Candidatus Bathyarchaeia archaeon]